MAGGESNMGERQSWSRERENEHMRKGEDGREGKRLVEATPIEADDDPGVWEEIVGTLECFDVFIPMGISVTWSADPRLAISTPLL